LTQPADTIFARIIRREIPARIEHEDDLCLAFHDVAPQAPVHLLVIPKRPLPSLAEATEADAPLLGHLVAVASMLARKLELTDGYRLVVNCGRDGGQTVHHLHVHLLGGRPLGWPPG
jgi:histidine triad (HIT) family protein